MSRYTLSWVESSVREAIEWVSYGVRWFVARRYGDRPECEECGEPAVWYCTVHGFMCPLCDDERDHTLAKRRGLEPADYFRGGSS